MHYYDIGDDGSLIPIYHPQNTESFDYWRVFTPNSNINLLGGQATITLTRNPGDDLDLKSSTTYKSEDFIYRKGSKTLAKTDMDMSFGPVRFSEPENSKRRMLSAEAPCDQGPVNEPLILQQEPTLELSEENSSASTFAIAASVATLATTTFLF